MSKIPVARIASRLAAMRPCNGYTQIFLSDGEQIWDMRRVRSLVTALARHYAVDLVALRHRCRNILQARNFLPLPLAGNLLLVPLPLSGEGGGLGYVNYYCVQGVGCREGQLELVLAGGTKVGCCLARATLHKRLLAARLVVGELNT